MHGSLFTTQQPYMQNVDALPHLLCKQAGPPSSKRNSWSCKVGARVCVQRLCAQQQLSTSDHQYQAKHLLNTPPPVHHVCVHTGSCYEDIVDSLAHRALSAAKQLPQQQQQQQQHIVGIAGSPGSGKSTLAQLVAHRINSLASEQGLSRGAAVAPMDGFHYYQAQLDQMPDPQVWYVSHLQAGELGTRHQA